MAALLSGWMRLSTGAFYGELRYLPTRAQRCPVLMWLTELPKASTEGGLIACGRKVPSRYLHTRVLCDARY
eukprot:3490691-Rhodomonas_salina.1